MTLAFPIGYLLGMATGIGVGVMFGIAMLGEKGGTQ